MPNRERQRFGSQELAIVLSHYDIGVVESITEFNRGSSKSPKVGIVSDSGKFLLKKRASQRRSERRVALAHAVQRHLGGRAYPLAGLVMPRGSQEDCVRIGSELYELFEFVDGHSYSATVEQTADAGRLLGRFHKELRDFSIPPDAPVGSYHDLNAVRTALNSVTSSISSHDSVTGFEMELDDIVQELFEAYDRASEGVNSMGFASAPVQIVHGDWHPGNMLFRRDDVVAVIDYDSCRVGQRVVDVANGSLQFSLTTTGKPSEWPDLPDLDRFDAFVRAYAEIVSMTENERLCLPRLMIEALIAEGVAPIAQTGHFGRWTGFGFLRMIARKVRWLGAHMERLSATQETN